MVERQSPKLRVAGSIPATDATEAIEGLYRVSGLDKPTVVVVPSPLVMAFAYGASAYIWGGGMAPNVEGGVSPGAAGLFSDQDIATGIATDNATRIATGIATRNATGIATRNATRIATRIATGNATGDGGSGAYEACFSIGGKVAVGLASKWWYAYQGGNMWAAYDCYLTAARDILGLQLPEHDKYKYWEQAAINGGFRVMHEKFCLVCDTPEVLKIDENNEPHCEDGPSHRWRDGWSLYHWHGVAVPESWIMGSPTAKEVLTETNIEVRAAGFEIIGWANMLNDLGATLVDSDPDPFIGELYSTELPGLDGKHLIVKYTCPRNGIMGQPVPNVSHLNGERITTIMGAKAWLAEMTLEEYMPPEIRT